jgi:hypothetical protein
MKRRDAGRTEKQLESMFRAPSFAAERLVANRLSNRDCMETAARLTIALKARTARDRLRRFAP